MKVLIIVYNVWMDTLYKNINATKKLIIAYFMTHKVVCYAIKEAEYTMIQIYQKMFVLKI